MMRMLRIHDAGIGYVSASPTGDYMGTTVFKNGSLARERVRDQYGMNWAAFSEALRSTPPGNHGAMMLPWFDPEITPHVLTPGVRRVSLDPADARGERPRHHRGADDGDGQSHDVDGRRIEGDSRHGRRIAAIAMCCR